MDDDGFEVPLHQSLTAPILLAGVPRVVAILNGTFVGAFALGMHSFFVVPLGLILHVIAVYATKRDPEFFECFRRHIKQKSYYRA